MRTLRSLIGLCVVSTVLLGMPSVHADNVYRINMRTYRHMMATNAHAYRNMMYTKYPSLFSQHFGPFLDNSVLQPNGPAALLLQRLLQLAAVADAQDASTSSLVAKREVTPDPDLTATLDKTRDILKTLNVAEPKPTEPVSTNPTGGGKDYSHFNEEVQVP